MKTSTLIIATFILIFAISGIIILLMNTRTPAKTNNPTNFNNLTNKTTIQSHYVTIINNTFSPSVITINKGDRVAWMNKDSTPHTVTSDSGNKFNSSILGYRDIYSKTLNTPGNYTYHCYFHSDMKGTVIVQ